MATAIPGHKEECPLNPLYPEPGGLLPDYLCAVPAPCHHDGHRCRPTAEQGGAAPAGMLEDGTPTLARVRRHRTAAGRSG